MGKKVCSCSNAIRGSGCLSKGNNTNDDSAGVLMVMGLSLNNYSTFKNDNTITSIVLLLGNNW